MDENCKEGTDDWKIHNYFGDIEGYANQTSVNLGERIVFFINTTSEEYDLFVYRTGYYDGKGGRLISQAQNIRGIVQPECHKDYSSGLTSCTNWLPSYSLMVSKDWVSGIYLVKLIRNDTGGENYVIFVVRDDLRDSDILYQQSVSTYQAYNNYGGKSLYSQISTSCITVSNSYRAVKVSFDRPYSISNHDDYKIYNPNSYLWSEYPMVFWLEEQGYDVSYSTSLDTHRSGKPDYHNELLDHQVFLSVGHDEYWTQEMRDAVTEARDAGVHLGFFSANTAFKKIRLEPDPWSGEPERVIVSYKTYEGGPVDPSGQSTSTWRDPDGPNFPENELVGVQYIGDNDTHYFPLRVTSQQAQDRIYRNTGLEGMPADTYTDIGKKIVGWEWDAVVDNGLTPANLVVLAESPVNGPLLLDAGSTYQLGMAHAQTARYQASSGAMVFAAATNQWPWGLGIVEPNPIIQQITYNLLSDMNVFPATPAKALVLDDGPHTISKIPKLDVMSLHKSNSGIDPVISNLSISVDGYQVNVTWNTDTPTIGQVWIKSASGNIDYKRLSKTPRVIPILGYAANDVFSDKHQIRVELDPVLNPTSEYFLQVASTDDHGHTTIYDEVSFRITDILLR